MTKENLQLTGYSEFAQVLKHQESLLFQRFNYFLVANAFLITAFASIFINIFNHPPLWGFGLVTSLAGVFVSLAFSAINLHNAKIIELLYSKLSEIENGLINVEVAAITFPYDFLREQAFKQKEPNLKYTWKMVVCDPFISTKRVLCTFFRSDDIKGQKITPAPHTWVIPLFFFMFWMGSLVIYIIVIWLNIPVRF